METNKNKLPIRGNLLGFFALGSTVVALAAVKLAPQAERYARAAYDIVQLEFSQPDDSEMRQTHYTRLQLARMPGQAAKAHPGDGFDNLSLRVNPNADISSTGARVDLRHYLEGQLEARTGRDDLQQGDTLCVPRVPHEKPEPPIPPSARC